MDAGIQWETNSLFHPLSLSCSDSTLAAIVLFPHQWLFDYIGSFSRREREALDADGLSGNLLMGLSSEVEWGGERAYDRLALQPFVWGVLHFHRSWYARIYARFTNEPRSLRHYSGVARDLARAGLKTGEIDQSVIGYRNEWATVEFGRSREIWGPMTEDNPVLSGNAPAYERLMLEFRNSRFAFRSFFGFLEAVRSDSGGDVQRYIAGRALEYNNRHNLVLGVAETSILAGEGRPPDLAFLNPLALHVEVEQNHRANATRNRNNAIWSIYGDWLAANNLRLSTSFVIDEFKLERAEVKRGAPDALGYFARAAWTPWRAPIGLTLIASYLRIDTYTYQHNYPWTNFVTRGQLLGSAIGNDADRLSVGMRMVFKFPILMELHFGRQRWGGNSLHNQPYKPYIRWESHPFPSGEVRDNRFLELRLDSHLAGNFDLWFDGHLDLSHSGPESSLQSLRAGARYTLPCGWR